MVASTTSVMTNASPKFLLFDLPFVFDTEEDIPKIISRGTAIGDAFYENPDLAERNMKVLGIGHSGFKQLTANREVRNPDDFRGLKMRVQPSDVLRDQMEMWGANAVAMPFSELYNALQQGVVDGQENPYTSIYSTKVHEVQSNLTELNHGYNLGAIMVNTQFFGSLPKDLQQAMIEAGEETSPASQEAAKEINAKDKERIEDEETTEIYMPSEDERQAFRDMVVPKLWDEYADRIGPELIEELKAYQQ
jgi:C4-dicarboxylate-binding protein DctP